MWAGAAVAKQRHPASALSETLPITLPPATFTDVDPDRLQRLVEAYPQLRLRLKETGLVWPDGVNMSFDDGREKSFAEALADPDLQDQIAIPYPRAMPTADRPPLTDPGRIRFEPFFRKAYGASLTEVRRNLVPVTWLPRHNGPILWFTRINGVAERVGRVSAMLQDLPDELLQFVRWPGGSFYWRQVAGSSRLSSHSFGIAIDIGTAEADYWQWNLKREGVIRYANRIPSEIVAIFESEGFIWGGKWYHFDTMHFEYRPELL